MSTISGRPAADERLKTKNRAATAISRGHRAAKAPKAAGTDTIFTLCSAHPTARRG
jgi:hypothetical protein